MAESSNAADESEGGVKVATVGLSVKDAGGEDTESA